MSETGNVARIEVPIKQPFGLSERIRWLRDYYFSGVARAWNNEFSCWTTGTPWDEIYDEVSFHIVPETYAFFDAFRGSTVQAARAVPLPPDFWSRSLPERRAAFIRTVMVDFVPAEVLPGDLLAGARFNLMASRCWTEREARERGKRVYGKGGAREALARFHDHGYGNAGATSAHLCPDYARVLREGWQGILADLERRLGALSERDRQGSKGAQLRAMITAAGMPRDVAAKYAAACRLLAESESDPGRRDELLAMAGNLDRVPWQAPRTFWEAVQALWMTHMLVMSDENYPGAGLSFGRFDQYLEPFWTASLDAGMDREFGKEILKCFWIHCNTVYDAMIKVGGNQGITAGFGQLVSLSGLGAGGHDMTNDLTWAVLEVIDELSPILEPKPNVRLHRGTPDALLDRVVAMISGSQGAPFLLNFDERSMAGMMREARLGRCEDRIHEGNVFEYAPVGCLENTMVGNDRSGTVDVNLNLLKAVELALTGGADLANARDPITGADLPIERAGPDTGDATRFERFEQFFDAYAEQTRWIIRRAVEQYERTESVRAEFSPTPYLSCLVRGCAEKCLDVTQGGAELSFVTIEGVTFATTVDSLLAIRDLVFDRKRCTMAQLVEALRADWKGFETLQAWAKNRSPKYGRDDDVADALALRVMDLWTDEVWKHRTRSTLRQFRPGMLSWNYWVGDAHVLAASADGRPRGQFLSNAICPSNGADVNGPTANTNSVGKVLGGRADGGDWEDWRNSLPNGASHTITFNPSLLDDPEHRDRFKAFLRGYIENGGTALQINMLDADVLRLAQRHPADYRHLLVRVTGYNAYFTSIGRELQDEVIARESHRRV